MTGELTLLAAAVAVALLAMGAAAAMFLVATHRGHRLAEDRRLRLAWDSSADLMAMLRVTDDGRFRIEQMNPAGVDWFRRAFPSVAEADWLRLDLETVMRERLGYSDAEIDAVLASHREAVRSRRPVRADSRLRTQGKALSREALFSPVMDAAGRVTHLFYRASDTTELDEARERELAMTAHFERVFRLMPEPVSISTTDEGRFVEVNDAWLQMYGYTREQVIGRTVDELRLWVDPGGRAQLLATLRAGKRVTAMPVQLRTAHGTAHGFLSAERISWKGEASVLVAMRDLTALHHATQEIRHLNESLEEKVRTRTAELQLALRELESFSYSVSHDLRAPLRHIAGFTRLLLESGSVPPGSDAARFAGRAAAAATRLGTLIDQLLEYSRLGRKSIEPADTDLARTVASILEDIATDLAGREIDWQVGALPTVRADPTLIRLLLQNLIENAVKYTGTRPAARIEVAARRDAAEDVVWVRDNGVGFDMQYSGKLFGVFQRMHTDSEFEGTGIGLANAKRIVERHGGRIWCEAAPERGATFYFALPRPAPLEKAA